MKYLSPLDAAFLRMESTRTPMHVGALMTFRLPEDAPRDFLRKLLAQMRTDPFMPPPFGCRLAQTRLRRIAPAWEDAPVDMDYHIRHSALPYPGGERELGVLVARLHSHPMDFARPLWECHLIEGLENNRFGFYFKAHHCCIDGMGAMRMVKGWLSEDADDRSTPGLKLAKPEAPSKKKKVGSIGSRLLQPAKFAGDQIRGLQDLLKALRKMSQQGPGEGTRAAMATPRSLFNVPITAQRRLGTQLLDLARVKAVSAATGATVNDVSLAIIGGAVRRYLMEQDKLPAKTLMASVPVGLARGEGKGGNAVAGFVCPLLTDEPDPVKRLERIHQVTTRSKGQLMEMSPAALGQFALLGLSPLMLGQMTGVLPKLPPLFNFVVSNVVLSKNPLYLLGAQLEAMYPVSFLFDGYALNITLVGYMDRIAVGILGCRDSVPRLQRLAVYTGEALAELEAAIAAGPARKTRKSK
jgi:WS/DGAT/MGAT family acyltransferase